MMKYQVKINNASTIEEVQEYWTDKDYIQLLKKFDYPDAENALKENLRELLLMAITDYEPNEAAAILLDYKLSDDLKDGQIQQISNDMLLDKIAEEYPEIHLHARLFHVNQLLFKAFNGKFPNTKASLIDCTITPLEENEQGDVTKEMVLKILSSGLAENNLIKRLFGEKLEDSQPFTEADSILWELKSTDNKNFKILTSDYWLSKDDFTAHDFEGEYTKAEESEEA